MNIQKQLLQLKTIAAGLEEKDRNLVLDLVRRLEKHQPLEEPDEYVDFFAGCCSRV